MDLKRYKRGIDGLKKMICVVVVYGYNSPCWNLKAITLQQEPGPNFKW